jgi:alkylated DNA repair protein (DNA oxidative demethylase)
MTIDPAQLATSARTGHWHLRGFLDRAQQDAFVEQARALARVAPFMHPRMRSGAPLSVKVSSFGERGWWADAQGYRYVENPRFPPIPECVHWATSMALWEAALSIDHGQPDHIPPIDAHARAIDTCLVNLYEPGAQLGWHVDQTERDRTSPIVTFSIGATCTFSLRMEDEGATRTFRYTLESGDAIVMAGPSRLAEHMVSDVRLAVQTGLFSANYNPLAATAPGSRLSFTVRRTGWA